MRELVSRAALGARMIASVKWYNVSKGYGFLTPGDGLPDIFCFVSVLQDVGLDTLLQGATVTCEVVQGNRGPQVAKDPCRRFLDRIRNCCGWQRPYRRRTSFFAGRPPVIRAQDQGVCKMVRADEGLRVPGAGGRFRRYLLPRNRRASVGTRYASSGRVGDL